MSGPIVGGLEPTPIRQGGPPAKAVIGVFAIALVAVIGFGVFGQAPTRPAPAPSAAASIAAVPTPSISTTPPTPTPAPTARAGTCQTGLAPIAGGIPRHPRPLEPPPLVSVAGSGGLPYQVVASGDAFWTLGSGRLTRSDGAGATTGQWDFLDDPTFGSYTMSPARGGGVWLATYTEIRWFDGQTFVDVIPSPTSAGDLTGVAEAPDGSVWATMYIGPAKRWDGVAWTTLCDDRNPSGEGTIRLAFAPDDTVWVQRGPELLHYDMSGAMLASVGVPDTERRGADSMTVSADGAVWVAAASRVDRFDGRWTTPTDGEANLVGANSLTPAADGSIWAAAGTRFGTCCSNVVRYDGTVTTVFDPPEELRDPAQDLGVWSIAVHGPDVMATTSAGTFRIATDGPVSGAWTRVSPAPNGLPDATSVSLMVVDGKDRLIASSGDRLWDIRGGDWKAVDLPGIAPGFASIDGMARSADGSIALATSAGALVRTDGKWAVIEPKATQAIAFDDAGACWLAPGGSDPNTGEPIKQNDLYRFTRKGDRWVRSPVAVPDDVTTIESLVVGPDGDVWLRGMRGEVPSLWHRHGKRWALLPVLPGTDAYWSGRRMAVTPGGDLVVGGGGTAADPSLIAYRFHGTAWSSIHTTDAATNFGSSDIVTAGDGTIWVAGWGSGLMTDGPDGEFQLRGSFSGLGVDARGTAFVAGPSGIYRVRR